MLQSGSLSPGKVRIMKNYLTILACIVMCFVVFYVGCEPETPAETDTKKAEPVTPAQSAPEADEGRLETQADTSATEPDAVAGVMADAVAVTVNGVDITQGDVEAKIAPQLERMAAQDAKVPPQFIEQYKRQLRQQALETMIIEQLLDEKIKENGIVVAEEEVMDHFEQVASQQQPPLSLEDIKALIEASGQSFDTAKERIRKRLGYQKVMEAQWAGKANFTEEDAQKYYSENIKQFETPEQVRASHILITPDTADPNSDPNEARVKAKAKAEDLLGQIKDGADFATLAKANSACSSAARGGDLNFFRRGQMVPAFEDAAFGLKVGQVSDVVETQFGYHVIKLTDHKDADVIQFEQAKDDIVKVLTQEKQSELAEGYIESLKAEANIVYPAATSKDSDTDSGITVSPTEQTGAGSESSIEPESKATAD